MNPDPAENPFSRVKTPVAAPPLGPEGNRRRLAIRERARGVVRRRRVTRLTTRGLLGALLLIALGAVAFDAAGWRHAREPASSPDPAPVVERHSPPVAGRPPADRVSLEIVENEPGILDRYRIEPSRAVSLDEILIDDSSLQDLLRSAGRPVGLVRVGGRVVLASNTAALVPAHPD